MYTEKKTVYKVEQFYNINRKFAFFTQQCIKDILPNQKKNKTFHKNKASKKAFIFKQN